MRLRYWKKGDGKNILVEHCNAYRIRNECKLNTVKISSVKYFELSRQYLRKSADEENQNTTEKPLNIEKHVIIICEF